MAYSARTSIPGPVGPVGPAGPAGGEALIFDFGGDNFDIPNNSDWAVSTPAAIIADPSNNALTVAALNDSTPDEGVGGELYVPAGARTLKLNFVHRAATAPTTGDKTVDYQFHFRKVPDNASIPGSWTTVDMAEMTIPNNSADYHYELRILDLTTIGMDTGAHYKWEITRYTAGTDDLSGDLYLLKTRLEVGTRSIKWFPADTLASAGTNWAVTNNAPIATDSNNAALKVRRHDDTTEEGSGVSLYVPPNVTKLKLHVVSRGEDATGGNVEVTMHYRKIPDNATIETWQDEDMASVVVIPTNENFQYDSWTMTLSTLTTAITADTQYQFQITRNAGVVGDTYGADWSVLAIGFEFYEE